MPTYELLCPACGERSERFLKRLIRDEDRVCPSCGHDDAKVGVGGGFLGAGTRQSAALNRADSGGACGGAGFG